MRRGESAKRPRVDRLRHERELRAHYHGRRAPQPYAFLPRELKQLLPLLERVGHRLLAPDVLAVIDGGHIEPLVLLHVGEVDEQVEGDAAEHLVDVRVMARDIEALRLFFGSLRPNVAQAHDLRMRALGQMRQIRMRHASAPDDPDANSLCLPAHAPYPKPKCRRTRSDKGPPINTAAGHDASPI